MSLCLGLLDYIIINVDGSSVAGESNAIIKDQRILAVELHNHFLFPGC
jgi:hypothetical protein